MFQKFWGTFWLNIEEIFEFKANKKATLQVYKIDRYKRYLKYAQNGGEVGGGGGGESMSMLDIVKGKTHFYVFPMELFFNIKKRKKKKSKLSKYRQSPPSFFWAVMKHFFV